MVQSLLLQHLADTAATCLVTHPCVALDGLLGLYHGPQAVTNAAVGSPLGSPVTRLRRYTQTLE